MDTDRRSSPLESLYRTLEFDQLLERFRGLTVSPPARERVDEVRPLPTAEAAEAAARYAEMYDLLQYQTPPPLEEIGDLRPLIKRARIIGSRITVEEAAELLKFLGLIRRLHRYFSEAENLTALETVAVNLTPVRPLEERLHQCIDPDTLEVKDSASSELAALRKSIERAAASARRKMEERLRLLASEGVLQENVIAVRNGRLVLMVKDEFRRRVKGLVHDRSASGSSCFIEPLEVVEDNNRIRELMDEEQREIERILQELSEEVRGRLEILERNLETFTELDFIHAGARLAQLLHASRPELDEAPLMSLRGARHPLLLLRLGYDKVVPLSVDLGPERHTLIISGPNAGGKTVALKTIGLLTLMARCGLLIPADPASRIGAIDTVIAVIGDRQSIENDLSTFSSHLLQLKEASTADQHTLLLVDELGDGTDPEEGAALSIAFLEHVAARGCLTVVTTHHGALKAFAYRAPGVENGSMEFDIATLQPTFHFRSGIPGSSYAFEIARRLGLPSGIIERARELAGEQKNQLEGLILELDEKVQQYKHLVREADLRETEYRGLLKLYQEKNKKLEAEIRAIRRQAAEEAERLLLQSNRAVEQAVREIREAQAEKEVVKAVRSRLQERLTVVRRVKDENRPAEETTAAEPLAVGDDVIWKKSGAAGKIIEAPDKKNRVMVQFDGGVKALLPAGELTRGRKKTTADRPVRIIVDEKPFRPEIDLRGMMSEEAIDTLAKFLDEALLHNFGQISIIHGKGTGRLRKAVAQFLSSHPQVEDFRLGHWNEGEAGVTVAYFKGYERPKEGTDEAL